MTEKTLKRIIKTFFNKEEKNGFIHSWYRQYGKSYTIVFNCSIEETNIQYFELYAQLQKYFINKKGNSCVITSGLEFENIISNIITEIQVNIFQNTPSESLDTMRAQHFYDYYYSYLSGLVVVEPCEMSCNIHIPFDCDIDIESIVSGSGYIHSFGLSVYSKNCQVSKSKEIKMAIKKLLKNENIETVRMEVFSDNRFGKDKGLEALKFHQDKHVIDSSNGRISFLQFVDNLVDYYKGKLIFSDEYYQTGPKNTIFVFVDKNLEDSKKYNNGTYYTFYYQQYLREDSVQLFDENKPGWIDHTTIPHNLISALLNVASTRVNENPVILDPFIGAGTTLIESLKPRSQISHLYGNDLSPHSKSAIEDNINILTMDIVELNKVYSFYTELREKVHHKIDCSSYKKETVNKDYLLSWLEHINYVKNNEDYSLIINKLLELIKREKPISDEIINEHKKDFHFRLFYYVYLRSIKRDDSNIPIEERWISIAKQLTTLIRQFYQFICLRIRKEKHSNKIIKSKKTQSYQGKYSPVITCDIVHDVNELYSISTGDAIKFFDELESRNIKADIIITDPPYGVNTLEGYKEITSLYANLIPKCIKQLNDIAVLIIVLPEATSTGKKLNYFTVKEFVELQIQLEVSKAGKKIINTDAPFMEIDKIADPIYWISSRKALERSIIFKVITK